MTTIAKTMARLVNRAMFLHQNSFDSAEEDYTVDFQTACDEAAIEIGEPKLGRLIYLAADAWWNDVEIWAVDVLADDQPAA